MKDYNKIIESLDIKFIKTRHIKVLQSLTIENFYDVENILIILNKGQIRYVQGEQEHTVGAGEVFFIPGGKPTTITYGESGSISLHNDYLLSNRWKYFQAMQEATFEADFENFSYITFDAKVFGSVNFFASLDIPPFVIKDNEHLTNILKRILLESSSTLVGSSRIIKVSIEQLVIEMIRHILYNNLFVEKLATNSNYFKDERLIKIFDYIRKNLGGDLSNGALAKVAQVSEDYVGQYFKMLTGINPQDYIEYQRMEYAVKLLRTTKKSIHDIGKEIGFKDTAYFCRRFKMMFGLPASKMRKRETLMSV
ncbi:MAG: AraC family transcriptional regulator [Roseivirga sp.]